MDRKAPISNETIASHERRAQSETTNDYETIMKTELGNGNNTIENREIRDNYDDNYKIGNGSVLVH